MARLEGLKIKAMGRLADHSNIAARTSGDPGIPEIVVPHTDSHIVCHSISITIHRRYIDQALVICGNLISCLPPCEFHDILC